MAGNPKLANRPNQKLAAAGKAICDRHHTSVASTEPALPRWPAPHFASTITQLNDYATHNKPSLGQGKGDGDALRDATRPR
jgi:hypothetical protein